MKPPFPIPLTGKGRGRSGANSLFEDNAEFGYGIYLGVSQIRQRLKNLMEKGMDEIDIDADCKNAFQYWLENMDNGEASKDASRRLLEIIERPEYRNIKLIQDILRYKGLSGQEIHLDHRWRWLGLRYRLWRP